MSFLRNLPHYSYKTALLASLLFAGAAFPGAARAAAPSEYSVDNVTVDSDGTDTTDARTKALAQGEKEAFRQLLAKKDPAKASELIAQTPPAKVSVMVRGYEIIDEKMTAAHYHATLRYNFDPRQIQALLGEGQPPAAAATAPASAAALPGAVPGAPAAPGEHPRKAVLVLPVYSMGGTVQLWQEDNKWRNAWYDAALEAGGGLVIAPLGGLNDRVDVDDSNVQAATAASLARMYDRYGVGQIYVISAFFNQKADPKPALEVNLRSIAPGGATQSSHMSYTIRSTETLDTLLARASDDIAHQLYKQQTIDPNKIEYERLKEISARTETSDIREWEALRKRLLTRGNIVGIRYTSISFNETTMTITFKGTPDMLGKTLVAAGLRVMEDGNSLVLAIR